MVMAKEEAVRTNRLALLTQVARLFAGIADFSRIA
jgi:glycyl-tRNA synthetase beta chain